MAKKITLGNKKKSFASIREAAKAAGMDYMVLYMRITKLGMSPQKALKLPVRKYNKQPSYIDNNFTPIGA